MKLIARATLFFLCILLLSNCSNSHSETAARSSDNLSSGESEQHLDDNEIICKNKGQTGSRLGKKKVCATRKQWRELQVFYRQQFENHQRSSTYAS